MLGDYMYNKFATPAKSKSGKYLFCYFLGNAPEEERPCIAVSDDGYNFRPLNNNKPVLSQKGGTGCSRDPFIFRDVKGGYYIVATDMKSSLGWTSNHGIVSWHSDDLVHWSDETVVDFHDFDETRTCNQLWAPEVLYDNKRGEYLVYYSVHNADSDKALSIWYSYTKDFKSFTNPKELFAPQSGKDALDADIVEYNGKYYMCYKDECEKTVCQVVADDILGPYREIGNKVVTCTDKHVEGNCMYNIAGTDTFVMIMDLFVDGGYYMQQTDDMVHYLPVSKDDFSMDFHPRHGSMLHISDEEYNCLIKHFG